MKKVVKKSSNLLKKVLLGVVLGLLIYDGSLLIRSLNAPAPKPAKFLSIVRLVAEGGATFCSGTVIDRHAILTAAHCVLIGNEFGMAIRREGIGIRPSTNEDLGITAEVSAVRYQMDQAILIGDFDQFNVRKYLSDVEQLTNPDFLKQDFTSCGYPLGGPLYCTTIHYKELDNFMWKVKGALIPGMSGGGVIDKQGNVVAVNSAVVGPYSIVGPTYNLDMDVYEGDE